MKITTGAAEQERLSRRSMLRRIAITAACTALPSETASPLFAAGSGDAAADLKPLDALTCLLDALRRFPLVAIGDRHGLQGSMIS
jgi:hypothetical protein